MDFEFSTRQNWRKLSISPLCSRSKSSQIHSQHKPFQCESVALDCWIVNCEFDQVRRREQTFSLMTMVSKQTERLRHTEQKILKFEYKLTLNSNEIECFTALLHSRGISQNRNDELFRPHKKYRISNRLPNQWSCSSRNTFPVNRKSVQIGFYLTLSMVFQFADQIRVEWQRLFMTESHYFWLNLVAMRSAFAEWASARMVVGVENLQWTTVFLTFSHAILGICKCVPNDCNELTGFMTYLGCATSTYTQTQSCCSTNERAYWWRFQPNRVSVWPSIRGMHYARRSHEMQRYPIRIPTIYGLAFRVFGTCCCAIKGISTFMRTPNAKWICFV